MRIEPSITLQPSAPCFGEPEFSVNSLEQRRILALMRLITLLTTSAPEAMYPPLRQEEDENTLSLLSRLRAAHAVFALTSGAMQRVSTGAWVRRHLN